MNRYPDAENGLKSSEPRSLLRAGVTETWKIGRVGHVIDLSASNRRTKLPSRPRASENNRQTLHLVRNTG